MQCHNYIFATLFQLSGRKFYKSRSVSKKQISSEEDAEKSTEIASPLKQGAKKPQKTAKNENETQSQLTANEQLLLAAKEAEEATLRKTPVCFCLLII